MPDELRGLPITKADNERITYVGGWLDSLKVGVRFADRKQTVRYSTFNWTLGRQFDTAWASDSSVCRSTARCARRSGLLL